MITDNDILNNIENVVDAVKPALPHLLLNAAIKEANEYTARLMNGVDIKSPRIRVDLKEETKSK